LLGPGGSVADPGCLSRNPDPDFYPSWIPDPKTATKERVEKKLVVINSHKFHKIVQYSIFAMLKKNFWANFKRIIELFTQKIVKKFSKIWAWDLGSEIRDPGPGKNLSRIPEPGVKWHLIPDPDPQHWMGIPLLRVFLAITEKSVSSRSSGSRS
jgi:hypothetical protein